MIFKGFIPGLRLFLCMQRPFKEEMSWPVAAQLPQIVISDGLMSFAPNKKVELKVYDDKNLAVKPLSLSSLSRVCCRSVGIPGPEGVWGKTPPSLRAPSVCPPLSQRTSPLRNSSWPPESSSISTRRAQCSRSIHSTNIPFKAGYALSLAKEKQTEGLGFWLQYGNVTFIICVFIFIAPSVLKENWLGTF